MLVTSSLSEKTQVSVTNLFGHRQALGIGDRREFLLLQLLHSVLVISQIQLGAHKDDGSVGTMVSHLRVPLHREYDSEEMGITFQTCVCYLEHFIKNKNKIYD